MLGQRGISWSANRALTVQWLGRVQDGAASPPAARPRGQPLGLCGGALSERKADTEGEQVPGAPGDSLPRGLLLLKGAQGLSHGGDSPKETGHRPSRHRHRAEGDLPQEQVELGKQRVSKGEGEKDRDTEKGKRQVEEQPQPKGVDGPALAVPAGEQEGKERQGGRQQEQQGDDRDESGVVDRLAEKDLGEKATHVDADLLQKGGVGE